MIDSPAPGQGALIPRARVSREELWQRAVAEAGSEAVVPILQNRPLGHTRMIDIAETCGSYGWSIIHHAASAFPCKHCAEEGSSVLRFAHDLVNVKLNRRVHHPEDARAWAPVVEELWDSIGLRPSLGLQQDNHKCIFTQVISEVGSRCRDPHTGQFTPLIKCLPDADMVDIGPMCRDFLKFANTFRPAYEKGAEIGILNINDAAMASPALGAKGSVRPTEFQRRSSAAGYMHNHPSRRIGALSGGDIHYAAWMASTYPYRRPMLAISVTQEAPTGQVTAALVPPGQVEALMNAVPRFDGVSPTRHQEISEFGVRLWQWNIDQRMPVPNVFFKRKA